MNKVEIEVWPFGGGLICHEKECKFRRECANHETAGDFRTDDGFSPELTLCNGEFYCDTKYRAHHPAYLDKLSLMLPDNIEEIERERRGALCRKDLCDEMDNVGANI